MRARYARHPNRFHNRNSNSFRRRGVLADGQSRASHLPGEDAAADRSLPQPWLFVRFDANEGPHPQVSSRSFVALLYRLRKSNSGRDMS
jgi:hypothetical protein